MIRYVLLSTAENTSANVLWGRVLDIRTDKAAIIITLNQSREGHPSAEDNKNNWAGSSMRIQVANVDLKMKMVDQFRQFALKSHQVDAESNLE